MTTADGRLVTSHNYGVPTPRDLATSLGRVPRFVGHTRTWWTVLHHVALCYFTAERAGMLRNATGLRTHVLLHDSEESVVSDTPTTLKADDQRALGKKLHQRITVAYTGAPVPDALEPYLNMLDIASFRIEAVRVGPNGVEQHSGVRYTRDPAASLATHCALAYTDVQKLAHDPYEPAASELGVWWQKQLYDALCGDATPWPGAQLWKQLSQVAS